MARSRKFNYVELFSGCGGLSLGLESAGFNRLLANEISPMAAETFAYNLVKGARKREHQLDPSNPKSWKYSFSFLNSPPEFEEGKVCEKDYRNWNLHVASVSGISDTAKSVLTSGATPNLIVGNASQLADELQKLRRRGGSSLWEGFKDVDILAGGPPCQSFSMAGKRQKDHPRNKLFLSFVKVASALRPKVVLFENVLGITRQFREGEKEWHPWHEVCRAFRSEGFIPIPSLVNAEGFGVPQSRPRFIMIALREDIAKKILISRGADSLSKAIVLGMTRYDEKSDDQSLIFRHETNDLWNDWPEPLFPSPVIASERVSVGDAIGDLVGPGDGEPYRQGKFSKTLDEKFKRPVGVQVARKIANHSLRRHGARTTARFRLLRALAAKGFRAKSMTDVLKRRVEVIRLLKGVELYLSDGSGGFKAVVSVATAEDVGHLIDELSSAKHAQRCLDPNNAAPAQLSIPDDCIHWERDRVLTIREMARLQSFPDWFEFRSKETTGGSSRAYEVPQYTQVGNAVPPLLARSFGDSIKAVLKRLETA